MLFLDFQTRDKNILTRCSFSINHFLTGKYPKDHGIMSGFWARNDPPFKCKFTGIIAANKKLLIMLKPKASFLFMNTKIKMKDGGLVFHNYNDNQLVIKNDKLDIDVVYDLNVEEQAQFVAELILLNQLLVFNPIRDAQEIKYPDFWTISFGSLLYFERRTPIFNNSTKLMDYSIQFLIDHFNKVYNSKTAIEILITGSEVPSYKNKKSIGKIIFDMFGAHLRTDLQKTQELLPVIYLKEDRLKFKQEGCHKIRDFLKKHHFGFEVHCFVDHEEFLEQETHPLLLSKHKPIKKDSNDPNEKNQVHDIEENSFDISTFSFTVLLIILSFITIGVFVEQK
ncbi:renin receptor [Anaeramoeba ignava]|uniref:Renin receptor n=1 Tax=Anaeramoeba ignava TaxID=1746090 RepID=A0A9Q0LFP1_ANAIG|nr:renin receptor [Anaeramoeba ignava]